MARISGTWNGRYRYGREYGLGMPRSVPFRMSLTGRLLGRFGGYVRDDPSRGGQPERGRIHGRLHGDAVIFRKVMPALYVTDDDGRQVDLRELLTEAYGTVPTEALEHVIEYRGTLVGPTIRGVWTIVPKTIEVPGQRVFETSGGSGTFIARRTSKVPAAL